LECETTVRLNESPQGFTKDSSQEATQGISQEDGSFKVNPYGSIQKWVPRSKILFIIGKMRRDLDTPISWVKVMCNGLPAVVSRKYIFDEAIDFESEFEERESNENSMDSSLDEDNHLPCPLPEDTEDTSWWDDEFNHDL